jgi:hypothetical protein
MMVGEESAEVAAMRRRMMGARMNIVEEELVW